jgi:hypothetical protein
MESRLKIIKKIGISKNGHTIVLCKCTCGNIKNVLLTLVKNNKTKSCGCLQKEIAAKTIVNTKKYVTHGMTGRRIYKAWNSMKSRCDYKKNISYMHYGGKGISYDKDWKYFENFYQDMKNGYKDDLTLDRINGKKNYTKSNCRWINQREQTRNLNRNVKYKGECATDASIRLNGNLNLVAIRIRVYKWSKKRAFTEKPLNIKRQENYKQLEAMKAMYQ